MIYPCKLSTCVGKLGGRWQEGKVKKVDSEQSEFLQCESHISCSQPCATGALKGSNMVERFTDILLQTHTTGA